VNHIYPGKHAHEISILLEQKVNMSKKKNEQSVVFFTPVTSRSINQSMNDCTAKNSFIHSKMLVIVVDLSQMSAAIECDLISDIVFEVEDDVCLD